MKQEITAGNRINHYSCNPKILPEKIKQKTYFNTREIMQLYLVRFMSVIFLSPVVSIWLILRLS